LRARGSTLPRPRARINSRCPARTVFVFDSLPRTRRASPERTASSASLLPPRPAFPAAHFISRRVPTIKLRFLLRDERLLGASNIYSPRRLRKRKESRLRICYRDKPTITADFDWQMDARTRDRRRGRKHVAFASDFAADACRCFSRPGEGRSDGD